MTAQILASELANLIQESKRKHTDLRNAAEKSLEELKGLRATSEAGIAADLTQRPNFVAPFLIACSTKNVKFTGIAVVCLQRLVVSRALARGRLREVLDAFKDATGAGIDVQLKILQALPSLLQNYAEDLKGDLLAAALNICTTLQGSKNPSVNNIAAATLQPLVVSVFDKVVAEDKIALEVPTIGEAPVENGAMVQLRTAALDAYRVFNDLCLLTEGQKPRFLKSVGIPQTFGLELIESVLTNHAGIFLTHPEQANILRTRVMPFIISALSEKLNFAVTVRIVRILYTILRRHLSILPTEGEMALGLLTHMLDQDTALWKRSLVLEILKDIFAQGPLLRRIFAMYDAQDGRKSILRDLVAAFVRISTEKPALIGLGHQSTIPTTTQANNDGSDQAMLEASGISGIISSPASSLEPSAGISTRWSTMRVACVDQLDKTEPPSIPDTYIYSLTLACISGFSEGLAKFVLPLTVPPRKKVHRQSDLASRKSDATTADPQTPTDKVSYFKKNPIPVNPLSLEDHELHDEIKICAGIVEDCWPAVLATCSTLLYAALDSEYYHTLVRSFQKFAHVAGLLRLSTPRDAFLTTLGKAAVPSSVLTASTAQAPPATPPLESTGMFQNAKGLLSVDSLVLPTEKARKGATEDAAASLNTRNLLCLRALLNLGIALGPTLDGAWFIILGTLQEADLVLFSTTKSNRTSAPTQRDNYATDPSLLVNFGTEIKAVEIAASKLLESTIDFPNSAFLDVIIALSKLLGKDDSDLDASGPPSPNQRRSSASHRRVHSNNAAPATQNQEDLFALAKLGDIASINISRFINYDPKVSGWTDLTSELIKAACSSATASSVRLRAAEILVRIVLDSATASLQLPDDESRGTVQLRLLEALSRSLEPLQLEDRQLSVSIQTSDIEVHKVILEGLKSLLEQCGETFVSGWDIAFEIIGTVFVENLSSAKGSKISTRSARLIRSSFNSLQLICSDFLSSLPSSCFSILVDTLYRFCSQDDDLNISLTTVTFFWVLSDFISGRSSTFDLSPELIDTESSENNGSDAALWMLLLLRLTAVTADERLELRNSAIQTLLRIFDAYGDQLSPKAWSICLNSVIFKLLSAIESHLQMAGSSSMSDKGKNGWTDTSVVVLSGITNLLADYLDVLSDDSTFVSSWKILLDHFKDMLSFKILEINTAVFKGLGHILSRGNKEKVNFEASSLELAWDLWSESVPTTNADTSSKRFDNQDYSLAYISALQEIYRLIEPDLTVNQVKRMLKLMREAIQQASAAAYSADIEYLTPLQTQVLETLKMIRTDIDGVPAALIVQVAEFVALAYEPRTEEQKNRPTYIALSKASMSLSETLILTHSSDYNIYSAVSTSLDALALPIVLKYAFPITTKSTAPWRQATSSSLTILKSVLNTLPTFTHLNSGEIIRQIWTSIVTIANGITSAEPPVALPTLKADQDFDISSFLTLRELITPALGSPLIPDKTRRIYTESLFHKSLIHAPTPTELPQVNRDLLSVLSSTRKGRTVDLPPSRRSAMSYVCLDELISLVSLFESTPEQMKLAQAAAPYLILRCGLTLTAYIADQPLRGRIPQPLSQRKELLYVLKALVRLRTEPSAIPEAPGVESESKKHLLRLYPLLARCVRAASRDQEVLEWVGKALDEVGNEFGV